MQITEDFELPLVDQPTQVIPSQVANEKAFYGAAVVEGDDPISDYQTIKTELSTQGYSAILDSAEKKWQAEQDNFGKEYFTKLISDPTIDKQTKINALSLYSTSGYISKSLRDKYIENVAVKSVGNTVVDEKALDELLKDLDRRKAVSKQEVLEEDIKDSEIGIKEWAKATGFVGANVIASIPASIWGGLQGMIKKGDLIGAREGASELMQAWAISPKDPATQAAVNKIAKKLDYFEIPYNIGVSEVLKNTGNENAAIVGGLVTETIASGIVAAPILSSIRRIKRGIPKLKKWTPLHTTIIGNPKVGADLGTAAILDSTGQIATAIGEDVGTIISTMVKPKAYELEGLENYPSLDARLKKEIAQTDEQVAKDLEQYRWDPNIVDVEKREKDYQTILRVTQSVDTPTYQPANSVFTPSSTGTYIGKATFGRDKDLFYHSRNEVIRAWENVSEYVKKLPDELNSTVVIRDRISGDAFTPEQLMADSRFKSGLERLQEIPTKTDSGIPIKVGKTGKTRNDGTYVPAVLRKDKNNNPTQIDIDIDYIKSTFDDKPWTKPKVDGVTPIVANAFKTPEEYAKFVYLHEELHTTIPNTNGILSKAEYENLINQKALEKFSALKEEAWQKEPLSSKQFAVEWSWERKYDDLDYLIFGEDAVNAQLHFGIDASGLARSSLGQSIFGGVGVFPSWFEQAGARAAPRAARQAATIINVIKKKIANTPFRTELNELINIAEASAKELFTINEIQNRFPNLSKKDVESLFETHTWWRRVNHYTHALINLTYRNQLLSKGFDSGFWIDGKYSGAVNQNIRFGKDNLMPSEVWDFETESYKSILDVEIKPDGKTYAAGKQLVLLNKAIESDAGEFYEYGLVGDSRTKVDMLPDVVVPRIPGYSPIKTTAAWYIDVRPKKAKINGYLVESKERLRNLTRTLGAGVTSLEANKLKREFVAKYPEDLYEVIVRSDKDITFNRIMADQETHQEILRNAMTRGERLQTLNGPAPIEDRLTSLVSSVETLTRQNSMQAYSEATEKAFVKDFREFLKSDEFPVNRSDIYPLKNMSPEETKNYQNALAVWDQYAKIKSFGSVSDRVWAETLNSVADVFEKIKVPFKIVEGTRTLARKGNVLIKYPRQLASILFLSLNTPRQWIVQQTQLAELWGINPLSAPKRFAQLGGLRLALASKNGLLKESSIDFYEAARSITPDMDKIEFDKTVDALDKAGVIQSLDHNLLVHGIFNDIDRPLLENGWEQAWRLSTTPVTTTTRVAKAIGYNFAEANNRIGIWLMMKDKWIEKNPGKAWDSKEAIEEISYNEWKWSGSMSRAGGLPYQEGVFSIFMQFAAIQQKITMNMLQKNTLLSNSDKRRILATRMALYGIKTGVPFGALAYYFIDRLSTDPEDPNAEANAEVKKYANVLKRGLFDRASNEFFDKVTGTEGADLYVSGVSPYGESTTGIPHYELYVEIAKIWDGKPSTNPRFPAVGAIGTLWEAFGNIQSWFITKDVTNENVWKRTIEEAALVASGMNNAAKAELMRSTGGLITKNGNKINMEYTAGEAFAKYFGISTWKEEAFWGGLGASIDRKERIDNTASEMVKWVVRQQTKMGNEDPVLKFQMMNSFITALDWETQDKIELYQTFLEKAKRSDKDINISFLENYLKSYSQKNSEELNKAKEAIKVFPQNKKLIDILDGKGTL